MIRHAALLLIIVVFVAPIIGQQREAPKPESPAKLELSSEVATTDDDGYPSALLITISNVGGVAVDMPVLQEDCTPDNGYHVQTTWTPDESSSGLGLGRGYGCGAGDQSSLMFRVQHAWVRLRPGESMTQTKRIDWRDFAKDGPGTVEYWVEYTPPSPNEKEAASLKQAGYIISVETLETQHSSFHVD
jgi:hypothetical protein